MKKWLALLALVALLLLGWIAAGPWIAIHGIRSAIEKQDAAKLSEYVDFPALRISLKQQIDDYVVRRAGADVQSSLLGAMALRLASGASSTAVDALATPAGLAALLEGRNFWDRLSGRRASKDAYAAAPPRDPLQGASYHYESLSRFSVVVPNADGEPVTFFLSRQGLNWRVTDVRLPFTPAPAQPGT